MNLGFPTNLVGYQYLVDAITMVVKNPDYAGSFNTVVYPEIARKKGKTVTSIERAIRNMIEATYQRHERGFFDKLFGYTVKKPTNSEFITFCAEKIRAEILQLNSLYNNNINYIMYKEGYNMIKIHLSRILGEKRLEEVKAEYECYGYAVEIQVVDTNSK
ncbi:MAG: sporulation initiation factor Spo0A C-terminal domain-containing protein [Ruminococcus sp.]|nr:sporulation initiation factor Spo0A C-terminal domain-containing protein [Ruminococcus sp.]